MQLEFISHILAIEISLVYNIMGILVEIMFVYPLLIPIQRNPSECVFYCRNVYSSFEGSTNCSIK